MKFTLVAVIGMMCLSSVAEAGRKTCGICNGTGVTGWFNKPCKACAMAEIKKRHKEFTQLQDSNGREWDKHYAEQRRLKKDRGLRVGRRLAIEDLQEEIHTAMPKNASSSRRR